MASCSSPLGSQQCDYSKLPDFLRVFLDSIGSMTRFERIDDNQVSFFLDEPDFRWKLMSVIGWSRTLTTVDVRSLVMTSRDADELCKGLSGSGSIETVRAGYQRLLGDSGAQEFATLLQATSSLKTLELQHSNIGYRGAMALGEALRSNKSLLKLDLSSNCLGNAGAEGKTGIEQLLLPLAAGEHQLPGNTTLQTLLIGGASNKLDKRGAKAVNRMLRTNKELIELAVNLNPLSDQVVYTLVGPLTTARINDSFMQQHNTVLKKLTVGFARKAQGGNGAKEIGLMVQHNHSLHELTLMNIEHTWEEDDLEGLFKALKQNEYSTLRFLRFCSCLEAAEVFNRSKAHHEILKSWVVREKVPLTLQNLEPSSRSATTMSPPDPRKDFGSSSRKSPSYKTKFFARIILCGHPDSGKDATFGLLAHQSSPTRKRFGRSQSSTSSKRIHVHVLEDNAELKVSLWNFSENEIYNCFQSELLLPNRARSEGSPTSFIVCVACDVKKGTTDSEIKEEISYWLRFIASSITTPTRLAPTVWILFSGTDQLEPSMRKHIETLARKYEEVLTVEKDAFLVHDISSAQLVRKDVVEKLKAYQQELPAIPRACSKVAQPLHGDAPWLPMSEWLHKNRTSLEDEERLLEVLNHLHDGGEIILLTEFEYRKIVVVKPEDLITEVIRLLNLLKADSGELGISKGFVLEHLWATSVEMFFTSKSLNDKDDKVILMRCLKLCYKSDLRSLLPSLFIPLALKGPNAAELSWKTNLPGIYVGRRFVSRDKVRTFITQSFFHQLQLELSRGELKTDERYPEATVELEPNLIRIVTDTLEIVVQFGALLGSFIDVMARSKELYTKTVSFIHKYVRNPIQKLSKSTKGLEEGLIRPACVQKLLPCKFRQTQVVMMKHLIRELRKASCKLDYEHKWANVEDEAKTWKLEEGSDLVIGCLDAEDCKDILKRKKLALSAVPPEKLSDFLTSGPCTFSAQGISLEREKSLHNLFVKHMVQKNTELQEMLFLGAMPTFRPMPTQ